jgi:thiol-disulfide isomerase/thioredoxin
MKTRAAALLIVILLASVHAVTARSPEAPAAPATAPAFSLPGRNGPVTLAGLTGKLIYVDFWASWCGPCRQSFPWMATMHARYAAKGLAVVAINLDKDRNAAETFLLEHPAPFLIAYDPLGKTAESFHVATMPSSYLIGPNGAILRSMAGFDPAEAGAVEQAIREALPQ